MERYYKLPKQLGGAVVKQVDVDGAGVYLQIPGMTYAIRIRTEDLTLAEPPAPPLSPEPGLRAVVLDHAGVAWQHQATKWRSIGGINATWEDLCKLYGPVKLLEEVKNRPADYWDTTKEDRPRIRWASRPSTIWTTFTRDGDPVQVEQSHAIGTNTTDPIVRIRYWLAGRTDSLVFTPKVARELAKVLKRAAGPKS